MSFKVGELVKGKTEPQEYYTITTKEMKLGEVIEVDYGGITIKILKHIEEGYIGTKQPAHNLESHFKKIKKGIII